MVYIVICPFFVLLTHLTRECRQRLPMFCCAFSLGRDKWQYVEFGVNAADYMQEMQGVVHDIQQGAQVGIDRAWIGTLSGVPVQDI